MPLLPAVSRAVTGIDISLKTSRDAILISLGAGGAKAIN